MSELAAFAAIKTLPVNVLGLNPAGTWSFVGRVSASLLYETIDGSPLDPAALANLRSFGGSPKRYGMKVRTWATREEAEAALAAL